MQYRKDADELTDLRSQGRKRLRAALMEQVENGSIKFKCAECGWIPVGELSRTNNLDANHINKDLTDCDPVNGEWLCRPCHKKKDSQTEKGVSVKTLDGVTNDFGYDLSILDTLNN